MKVRNEESKEGYKIITFFLNVNISSNTMQHFISDLLLMQHKIIRKYFIAFMKKKSNFKTVFTNDRKINLYHRKFPTIIFQYLKEEYQF